MKLLRTQCFSFLLSYNIVLSSGSGRIRYLKVIYLMVFPLPIQITERLLGKVEQS